MSRHWVLNMVLIASRSLANENSSFLSIMRPDSIRDMSRMSLIRFRRCSAEDPICSRYSLVSSGVSGSCRAMLSRPMIAFIGVRISWLMLDRNAVFARFASSAAARASLSA